MSDVDTLLELHDRRMKLVTRWKRDPPPEGFHRCDGYYGCGALTRKAVLGDNQGWICVGCGRDTLPVGRFD